MRGRLATACLPALALAGCGAEAGPPRVTVEDAVVTLPAVAGRAGAGYFRVETSAGDLRLTGLASPKARRIELHESGMRPAAAFAFSPAEPLRFAPGGRHAMLHGLDPALRPGARIPLTFTFEGAAPVTAEAEVRAPGDVHEGR